MTDNISLQAEEIEALCAIYGSEWHTEEQGNYSMDISFGSNKLTSYFYLPATYPLNTGPTFQFLAPALNKIQKETLHAHVNDVCKQNVGEAVLFQIIEKIKEFLNDVHVNSKENTATNVEECEPVAEAKPKQIFNVITGPVIHDRKSAFQAHVAKINDVEDVKLILEQLLENKKIAQATHNIYAYRMKNSAGTLIHDCDDDGEHQAGSRLMHLLEILNLTNVLVVVSRWYGGIHLGPDRFRHINNAARQTLILAGFISTTNNAQ